MPYVDDATEAAFIAADKESEKDIERFCKEQGISPASMAFAFGFRPGFRTAHPTWQAILAKRKAFAESPEGRARRAWIDMVIAANKLIAKGRAQPLDEGEEDESENENVENENDENESGPPPVKVPPNSWDKDKPEAVHVGQRPKSYAPGRFDAARLPRCRSTRLRARSSARALCAGEKRTRHYEPAPISRPVQRPPPGASASRARGDRRQGARGANRPCW
jgi:hypothetical protein